MITHNRREEAVRSAGRVLALPERPPLVVVDNESRDGTAAAPRAAHPAVDVLASPVNLGAIGRKLGAARLDTPSVALCGDDTWGAPGALARAADGLDAYPQVAALTVRIVVEPGGPEDRDRTSLRAFGDAVRGVRWMLAERRRVPPAVEARLAALEEPQRRSRARRYVG
jgi:GT2 family glycosyltransferase